MAFLHISGHRYTLCQFLLTIQADYLCKRVAKVDGSHLAALGWADLHFVS